MYVYDDEILYSIFWHIEISFFCCFFLSRFFPLISKLCYLFLNTSSHIDFEGFLRDDDEMMNQATIRDFPLTVSCRTWLRSGMSFSQLLSFML
ncbi:hypothetical protein ES332_A13G126300v1 [Gossypium tomentosum]|uniref:Uncharacterized protein n=1 Tax=Gossypium tomentosum TaxID=34277 RepID=A0A5D2MJI7_GOSTO|nr:hypothetical protein ES332_A13G126300v1 [Gossypium tomentosum]